MKFNKRTHKVEIDTLSKEQAQDFRDWLWDELWRHQDCVASAERGKTIRPSIAPVYASAITRHKEDIQGIGRLIAQLKEQFEGKAKQV